MSAAERLAAVLKVPSAHVAPNKEPDAIRRAFDIAPECGSLTELKRCLIVESYFNVNGHLSGWQIRRDLNLRLNRELVHRVPNRAWEVVGR
jgi:hypothetical protein